MLDEYLPRLNSVLECKPMSAQTPVTATAIIYPQSDGQPMADNTLQFRWIVTIKEGLEALFASNADVFVAGDLLWYPVEGRPDIRVAPDALVAFGRPKGERGSYLQWREGNIAPQVVFEILSPGNTVTEMMRKLRFYEQYGVEEYFLYDPDTGKARGWQRRGGNLEEIMQIAGWRSPRLGIRFEFEQGELAIYRPDGERFITFVEMSAQRDEARRQADQARLQADQARQLADQARQQANQAHQQADQARQRAERLAAQLRALGVEPEGEEP
jgi:Uma2 family endonuclease